MPAVVQATVSSKPRRAARWWLVGGLAAAVLAIGAALIMVLVLRGGDEEAATSSTVITGTGDQVVEGPGGSRVLVPAGSVTAGAVVTAGTAVSPGEVEGALGLGDPVTFEVTSGEIEQTVQVVLPFDAAEVPGGEAEGVVFAAVWVAGLGGWVPADGVVDWQTGTVTVETDHLSVWRLFAWLIPTAQAPSEPRPPAGVAGLRYVALGDSYSAGQGLPEFEVGTDIGEDQCHRSTRAFPRLVAQDLGLEWGVAATSRACTGAHSMHVTTDAFNGEAPQIGWLGEDTELVTVTIGGNDIGFAWIIASCVTVHCPSWYGHLGALSGMVGVSGAGDRITDRIDQLEPELVEVYQAITSAAPNAEVLVLGYPQVFAEGQAERCVTGFDSDEMEWAREKVTELDAAIHRAADTAGVRFVDLNDPGANSFTGHELCTEQPWLRGLVGPLGAENEIGFSMHPTADGQEAVADIIRPYAQEALAESPAASLPEGAYTVPQVDACVVGAYPAAVSVHAAADSASTTLGTLPADATGVHTAGWAALDIQGKEWRQIIWGNGTAWVRSDNLTVNACTVGPPTDYCLTGTIDICWDPWYLSTGPGSSYAAFSGTDWISPSGLQGTGASSVDDQGSAWVQLRDQGRIGWFPAIGLDAEPCTPIDCSQPLSECPFNTVFPLESQFGFVIDLTGTGGTCRSEWIGATSYGIDFNTVCGEPIRSGWSIVGDNGWSMDATELVWEQPWEGWWQTRFEPPSDVARIAFVGDLDCQFIAY